MSRRDTRDANAPRIPEKLRAAFLKGPSGYIGDALLPNRGVLDPYADRTVQELADMATKGKHPMKIAHSTTFEALDARMSRRFFNLAKVEGEVETPRSIADRINEVAELLKEAKDPLILRHTRGRDGLKGKVLMDSDLEVLNEIPASLETIRAATESGKVNDPEALVTAAGNLRSLGHILSALPGSRDARDEGDAPSAELSQPAGTYRWLMQDTLARMAGDVDRFAGVEKPARTVAARV